MTQDPQFLVYVLMAVFVVIIATVTFLLVQDRRVRDVEARVMRVVVGAGRTEPSRHSIMGRVAGALHNLGDRLRRGRFYSPDDLANLEAVIASAGLNPKRVLPLVLGAKVAMMAALPLAAIGYVIIADAPFKLSVAVIAGAFAVGMIGPDWSLGLIRRPYVRALRRGVPDALDLLVLCSEAGMGLESAIEQVSREMRHSNAPMATALSGLLDELRILPDRRQALTNFGARSGVEELRRLAAMLSQCLQYGTPLSQALRAIATELRRERMIRLEEKATKLPAKLVLPLVLFILPALLVVLVGTAFLRLFDALATLPAASP